MQITNAIVAISAAVAGVSAHPSMHGHQHFHEHRDLTFFKNKAPEEAPAAASPAPAPAPVIAPVSDAPKAAAAAVGQYIPFCSGKSKRATIQQIAYAGNTGAEDDWGCNMQVIDKSIASLYDYTAAFTASDGDYTCACFNKIGPKGLIDGCWFAAITFAVSKGQSKTVAFDKDSQGSCACGKGSSVPKTSIGQFAGTWLEFDWGSTPNGGNSGADASVLVAGAQSLPYIGMKVAANGNTCSWVKSTGQNDGAYMPGMEAADGVGCKGYYKGNLDVTLGDNFTA